LQSSKGQIALRYPAREPARELVRELVCDLLARMNEWVNVSHHIQFHIISKQFNTKLTITRLSYVTLLMLVSCLMCLIGEELLDLVTTLRRLNATEMIRAADAAGLRSSLATDNITVFAPINAAFDALHPPTTVALLRHIRLTTDVYIVAVVTGRFTAAPLAVPFSRRGLMGRSNLFR